MDYRTITPINNDPYPPEPPKPTFAELVIEELSEDPQPVEWMGLSLSVGIAERDGSNSYDDKDYGIGAHNYLITWRPELSELLESRKKERRLAEFQSIVEIFHPHLGRQIHEEATWKGIESYMAAGEDIGQLGAFGSCLSEGDAATIIQAAIAGAVGRVRTEASAIQAGSDALRGEGF